MSLMDAEVWTGKLLAGEWHAGHGEGRVQPATGAELGRVATASPVDVTAAFERAAAAQQEWAVRPYSERAAILRHAGDLWETQAEEVGEGTHTGAQECFEATARASHPVGEGLRPIQAKCGWSN